MNPKSQDVLKVIKNFEKIPLEKRLKNEKLKMNESFVSTFLGIGCGTAHCHGGWYEVATAPIMNRIRPLTRYNRGMVAMARHLGFENEDHLGRWANSNPDIWGNRYGINMFSGGGEMAFYEKDKRPHGAKNLQDIVNHWNDVYHRIVAMENEQKYQDIRKKLTVLHPVVQETPDGIVKEVKV